MRPSCELARPPARRRKPRKSVVGADLARGEGLIFVVYRGAK
jgi:hypothetical protein